MGVAGNLNDGADIPAPCGSYFPNDYGLYNMAGNVSEWVLDVYRPLTSYDVNGPPSLPRERIPDPGQGC